VSGHQQNNVIPEGFSLVPSLPFIKERDIRKSESSVKKIVVDVQSNVGLQHSPVALML
jgi:hypothetical protein